MIGKKVTVKVDRPMGSYHPEHKDIFYPINYGYIEGIMAQDGEEQDAYLLGVDKPVEEFTGIVIAIIHRYDDVEEKWVVAPENVMFSKEEIERQVQFQEQYFKIEIRMWEEMEQIILVEPQVKYVDEIWEFRQEVLERDAENEDQFAGCLSLDTCKSAEEWIHICELRKSEETCNEVGTAVPSHMYLAVRVSDERVVGVIDLRHHINHPILGTWGGHCGYSVRPSERGKGYAKKMLCLNVQNAKAIGIPKLLVTCNENNAASEKTILACGGVYENTIEVGESRMKRYWITV